MQRYQPPHQRHRGVSSQLPPRPDIPLDPGPWPSNPIPLSGPNGASSSASQRSYGGPRGPYGVRGSQAQSGGWDAPRHASTSFRSKKDWSAPALASPASDLRPMRAGTPGRSIGREEMDEMEMMQSVSRSGGDGAEGDALKDWGTQERYRSYIDERIDKHHAAFGTAADSIPAADSTDELQSLKSIVLLLRKLREGVVASHRIDVFAIDVFEASVRISILARDPPQLVSSLSGLVPGLYTAVDSSKGKGKATDPADELGANLATLQLNDSSKSAHGISGPRVEGDRRIGFASILLLYHLAHGDSYRTFFSTLMSITNPTAAKLRRPFDDLHQASDIPDQPRAPTTSPDAPIAFCKRRDLWYALRASRALAEETFNPLLYFALVSDPKASVYERAVLSWAAERVQKRAWGIMRKAYLECRLDWVGRWVGEDENEAGSWVEAEGGRVIDGKVPVR